LDLIFFRTVDDGGILAQQAYSATCGDHGEIANPAVSQIVDYILLCESFSTLVMLYIVVGEDAREFGDVGGDQRAITVFEKLDDLLFVGVQSIPCRDVASNVSLPIIRNAAV
jgi:hypothetical protein